MPLTKLMLKIGSELFPLFSEEIILKSKIFWHLENMFKVKSVICPVSFNIRELKLNGTGWRPGLRQYWNSSPEIRHFGSYLFSTDFKIEKSKYRHRKRRRNDSLYKFSNNFLRKIKIPRDKDAKSLKSRDVVLYEWSSRALLLKIFCGMMWLAACNPDSDSFNSLN